MNRRIWAAGMLVFAVVLNGCAAGTATSGGGVAAAAPAQIDEQNLPAWAVALPPGIEPRDNDHTTAATLAFFQADNASGEARRTRLQAALTAAQAGIALDPENPQSYLHAGRAHLGLDNFEEADRNFDRAEELYPRYQVQTEFYRESAWITEYNAAIEFISGNPTQALVHLERADLIYQWRPEAMMQIGQIYSDQEQLPRAIDAFVRAATVIASPRARELRDAETLAEWDNLREIALYNAGELMFAAERYADAAAIYEDIVAEHPDDLMAGVNLGIALVASSQVQRATDVFEDLMSRPGLTARDLNNIGAGLERANQLELAAAAFGRAHERMPMDFESIFYQVQSLYFAADSLRQVADTARANPMYRQVSAIGDQLIALDTHGSNSFTYYFNSLIHTRQETAATAIFNRLQALPFILEGWNMAPVQGGFATAAQIVNKRGAPGTPVRIRVHFFDGTGATAGTQETSVSLGAVDQPVPFQVDVDTSADVMGYRYEVVN